jgi:hypothetical protein
VDDPRKNHIPIPECASVVAEPRLVGALGRIWQREPS